MKLTYEQLEALYERKRTDAEFWEKEYIKLAGLIDSGAFAICSKASWAQNDWENWELATKIIGCLPMSKVINDLREIFVLLKKKPDPNEYNFGYGHNQNDQYKRDCELWEKTIITLIKSTK